MSLLRCLLTSYQRKKTISYAGCLAQCFVFVTLLLTEYNMLGAMAYDRYMAICNPLHYKIRMSRSLCICLVTFPYFWGSMVGTMQVILTSHLSFCGSNTINHFYCADPPLLMLTCSDTYIKQTALFVSAGINLTGSLLIILIFYVFIFITIMRIHSSKGQHKAQSLLHLWLPPDSCHYVLWVPDLHVSETSKQTICGTRENCVSDLHFCESHAKSIYL